MKKLILMLLGIVISVSSYADETLVTVYCAIPSSTVGTYTVKVNANIGDNNTWRQSDMIKTGITYNGNVDIYYGTFYVKYGGVDALQFQLYDGSTWKSQKQPYGSWTTSSTFNGKMYVYSSESWVNYDKLKIFHCKKTNDFTPVKGYDFYNSTGSTTWPGYATVQSPLNSNWYDYAIINRNCDGIIFNNGDTSSMIQTGDIAVSTDTEYWMNATTGTTSSETTPPSDYNYSRTGLTVGNFGTICLPYDATVEGATIFEISGKVMENETLTGINLTSTENNEVKAGKSYIFKATSTGLVATLSGNYTFLTTDNGMLGNLTKSTLTVPADDNKYVVSGNKICKVVSGGTGVTIGRYKAYITLTGVDVTEARGLDFISFDSESTGIEQVESTKQNNEAYYNLAGQRVANPTKGLYIVNGKKYIAK